MDKDIWPNGGRVSWLENTGDPNHDNWTMRTIGSSPGMHRLKAGHFTRDDRVQVCAIPIVVASGDLTTPAPVIIFTCPDDPKTADSWPSEVISYKHLVHDMVVVSPEVSNNETPFDQIVLAGRDGVNVLWYNGSSWETFCVGTGLQPSPDDPYWGAGSVALGRVDEDYAGYICCAEVRADRLGVPSPCIDHSIGIPRQYCIGVHEALGVSAWYRSG